MSEEDAEALATLLRNEDLREPLNYDEFLAHPMTKGLKERVSTTLMALWTRMDFSGGYFRMSIDASIFLSFFVRSIGDSKLYMSYAMLVANKMGVRNITLKFLTEQVFSWGMFDNEQLEMMWDLQQSMGSDLLDDGDQWKSHLMGDGAEHKVVVRFGEEDERPLTIEEFDKCGELKDPNEIEGRMFFWLGRSYVSTSKEDYQKITDR